MTLIRRISWVAVGSTYLLVALGGAVRANNAGLSCIDWQRCYARVFSSPNDLGVVVEQIHRISALVSAVLLLALAILVLLRARQQKRLLFAALAAPFFLLLQFMLGGLAMVFAVEQSLAIAHLAAGLATLAMVISAAVFSGTSTTTNGDSPQRARRFARLTLTTTLLVYGLLLSGSYVVQSGATLACPDWPLCGQAPEWAVRFHLWDINVMHRIAATLIGLGLAWTIISAWRRRAVAPQQAWLALLIGALFIGQSSVGAFIALYRNPPLLSALHLALATAVWASLALLSTLAVHDMNTTQEVIENGTQVTDEGRPSQNRPAWRATLSSYIDLMKPHVTVLLLGTTVAAMAIAYKGLPPLLLVLATLLGGAMAAGSANSINCYIDRDIDQIMGRTQRRSLPSGKVQPQHALIFGIVLGVGSFFLLWGFVNLLSAVLAVSAIFFYIFVYTIGLKRSTAQNIVIGGAAGAVPVLVGWAAVTNSITLPAIWLFAIIFYWTPPHFWALSLLIQKDYEKAGVPMMPVVMGERETERQIFLYSLLLLATTLILFLMRTMGYLYLVGALILGGILVYMSVRLLIEKNKKWARTLFWYSNCYLAAIFAIMVIDRVIQ